MLPAFELPHGAAAPPTLGWLPATVPHAGSSKRQDDTAKLERVSVNTPSRTRPSRAATTLVASAWPANAARRIYVDTSDDIAVGWLDLHSGERHLHFPELSVEFEAAVAHLQLAASQRHSPQRALEQPPPSPATTISDEELPGVVKQAIVTRHPAPKSGLDALGATETEVFWTDLALNVPGQSPRARADEELVTMRQERGRFRTFLARAMDSKTEERAWRVGAEGEETVGAWLNHLRADGWHVLHSVPVGTRNSDIDHVLIGPGGVFTLNTKTHRGASVWVAGSTVMVNGAKQPYIRNARFEADRSSKLLSRAVGWDVSVTGALVFLTGTRVPRVKVKDRPTDVVILDRTRIPGFFIERLPVLTPTQIEGIYQAARRSTTWR